MLLFIFLGISIFHLQSCSPSYKSSGWNQSNIQIARDKYGVPHIFGKTDADVAYGLAWAHSEDNFETIQQTVLAGKGMAGRAFGKKGAATDFFVALLQIEKIAQEKYDTTFSNEFKEVLNGYAAGLNDYALAHPNEVLVKKAFPINPVEITSAYILSLASMSGVDRAVQQIVNNNAKIVIPDSSLKGSNAFVFHSSKTTTGENFLVSNSHQPLEGPEAWYEAHLHSEQGWNIIGSLYPGGAMIFHGVNEFLGWAHTVNSPDLVDVYQLEMHPKNKKQYKVDNKWLTLEEKRIWLRTKLFGKLVIPVPKKVWKSIYGPTLVTENGVFAIHTGVLDKIGAAEQWWRMNKARNFTEFKTAMDKMQLTSFNVLYADKFDTIFYVSNALLPKRTPGFNYTSTIPGNTSRTLWKEYHLFSDLPQQINPSAGYLYNTNHSPFKASAEKDNLDATNYPVEMNFTLRDNNRSLRFRELIKNTEKISYEKLKEIKYDGYLPEKLAYRIKMDSLFLLDETRYPDISFQIKTIKQWDRNTNIQNEGAALFAFQYHYWRDKLRKANRDIDTQLTEFEVLESMRASKLYFKKYFNREVVSLGEYQKLVRGEKIYPIGGIDDVITTIRSIPWKNGMRKATEGESYIMMVRFDKNGPKIETVNVYGASNQKQSIHYSDQMELYLNHQLKPMTLNKEEVLKYAIKVYNPGYVSVKK